MEFSKSDGEKLEKSSRSSRCRNRGPAGIGEEMRDVWRIKEFFLEYGVPAVMGLLGSFVGMAIAHWLGVM